MSDAKIDIGERRLSGDLYAVYDNSNKTIVVECRLRQGTIGIRLTNGDLIALTDYGRAIGIAICDEAEKDTQ